MILSLICIDNKPPVFYFPNLIFIFTKICLCNKPAQSFTQQHFHYCLYHLLDVNADECSSFGLNFGMKQIWAALRNPGSIFHRRRRVSFPMQSIFLRGDPVGSSPGSSKSPLVHCPKNNRFRVVMYHQTYQSVSVGSAVRIPCGVSLCSSCKRFHQGALCG